MSETFSPYEIFQRVYQDRTRLFSLWWFLVIFMILGAGVGELVYRLRTPIFEAHSAISIGIDFTRTGALTDVEEDYAIGIIGDLIASPDVLNQVLLKAHEQGLELDQASLQKAIFLERQNNVWRLRVRQPESVAAEKLANLWAEQALKVAKVAIQHATVAERYHRYLLSLESCLEQSITDGPAEADCRLSRVYEIQIEMMKTGELEEIERLASQGVMPATTFQLAENAEIPTQPIVNGHGALIFGGALIGLALAIGGMPLLFGYLIKGGKHQTHD